MRCQGRHTRCGARAPQQGSDRIRVIMATVAAFKDEVLIMPERSQPDALFELCYPMAPEVEHSRWHQLNPTPITSFRASTGTWFAVPPDGAGGVDADDAGVEVEIRPGEG